MNERQRQDYLEAMGIQPWFPRFVLPAAKLSETCDWDYEDTPVAQVATSAHQPHVQQVSYSEQPAPSAGYQEQNWHQPPQPREPVPSSGNLKESSNILDDLGFTVKTEEQAPSKDSTAENSTSTEATVLAEPFRLAVVDVSETCLVVSDLPWSGLNQFTSIHQRLLSNILKALQLPSDHEWKQGLFVWPMIPDASSVDQKYAHEAVHAYLNNQFGLKRRKTILLFGRSSCSYLWSDEASFEDCRGIQQRDDIRYGITCSLGELLGIPALKAEAWSNLKALGPVNNQ